MVWSSAGAAEYEEEELKFDGAVWRSTRSSSGRSALRPDGARALVRVARRLGVRRLALGPDLTFDVTQGDGAAARNL